MRQRRRRCPRAQRAPRGELDALTGTFARAAFDGRLEEALARTTRGGRALTLALLDVDSFKSVNDTLGHQAGDVVLQSIAAALRDLTRPFDVVGRFGGDEFNVLLDDAGTDEAGATASRLLDGIESASARSGTREVTCTKGIAVSEPGAGRADLIRRADEALRAAKRSSTGGWKLASGEGRRHSPVTDHDPVAAADLRAAFDGATEVPPPADPAAGRG